MSAWKILVAHVNDTWKKRKGYGYPFEGKDFKILKKHVRNFGEHGLMGLWDAFMDSDSPWVKGTGYSIVAFSSCLPWLVDNPNWKMRASAYERTMFQVPDIVQEAMRTIKIGVV